MRRYLVSGASMIALTMLVACGGGEDAAPASEAAPAAAEPAPAAAAPMMNLPEGVTEAMVTEGDGIFHGVGICQTCHGPDAKGVGALAPDLTDATWLHTSGKNFEEIVTVITNGVPQPTEAAAPMPARGGGNLTEAQIRAVAAYVYSIAQ